MVRSRVVAISCLLAAVALTAYGLSRWPVERVYRSRRVATDFVKAAHPADRILGTVDYIAAALLFGVWPWLRFKGQDWKKRWRPSDERQSFGENVEGLVVACSLVCAVLMGLLSIGAVLSLFRSF